MGFCFKLASYKEYLKKNILVLWPRAVCLTKSFLPQNFPSSYLPPTNPSPLIPSPELRAPEMLNGSELGAWSELGAGANLELGGWNELGAWSRLGAGASFELGGWNELGTWSVE